ncbi:MAG: hypothetical protein GF313_12715 [Caldithrix sp.]|nr:hypothetical protein [Caldithrix sp.]
MRPVKKYERLNAGMQVSLVKILYDADHLRRFIGARIGKISECGVKRIVYVKRFHCRFVDNAYLLVVV